MDKIYSQFNYYIEKTIKECNEKSSSPNEIISICNVTSKQLFKIIEKNVNINKKYRKFIFFNVFFSSFLKINVSIKEEMAIITKQYESLVNKYSVVVNLLNAEQYESAIIIYRSLYEGLAITEYLLTKGNDEKINLYHYLSVKRFNEAFNIEGSECYPIYQKMINDDNYKILLEKNKYEGNDYEYGWTGIVPKKQKVKFEEILKELLDDEKFKIALDCFKVMYKLSSEVVHSNNSAIFFEKKILEDILYIGLDGFMLPWMNYIANKMIENNDGMDKKVLQIIYDIAKEKYKE